MNTTNTEPAAARFRVSNRPVHLTAGWRWLVWDSETIGFVEDVAGIDPNGYPTAEMAQAAIDALSAQRLTPADNDSI